MPIDPRPLAAALLIVAASPALAAPAPASPLVDDVRCLLLSTGFARAATNDLAKRSLALTGSFYLGRLSPHLAEPAVAAAIRAQGTGMRGAEALPMMKACAARANAAEQQLASVARQAQAAAAPAR